MTRDGVLTIDKPVGLTSHDVVARIKKSLRAQKVGHTGTLDPFATGVLVLGINQGTKIIPYLDRTEKEYRAVMVLGVGTDTQDTTGTVIETGDASGITRKDLERAMDDFMGEGEQCPPRFSAIKVGGVRLYEFARRGFDVEVSKRPITIYALSLVDFSPPEATFLVTCSPGTYIRTLAVDIGVKLGVPAHLRELKRTRSGPFSLSGAHSLDEVISREDGGWELITSMREAIGDMIEVPINHREMSQVANGGPLIVSDEEEVSVGSTVKLVHEGRLVALARVERNRGVNIKPIKVFQVS